MYIVLYWTVSAKNATILQEEDSNDCSGNLIFKSEEDAEKYAFKNCIKFTIVKLPEE